MTTPATALMKKDTYINRTFLHQGVPGSPLWFYTLGILEYLPWGYR